MQPPASLALLGAACCWTVAAAGSVPRGVGPEFVSYYQNKDSFTCIANPSITIPWDRVNDNTCDCPDGSDEPGTAACAFIDPLSPEQPLVGSPSGTTNATRSLPGFWCQNKGHIGAYIPFSYVNDGVCDYDVCCDGTDEHNHPTGIKCENRCGPIGKEHRRLADERKKNVAKAIVKKQEMIKEAAGLLRLAEARIAGLEKDIRDLSAQKEELQRKYDQVQSEEQVYNFDAYIPPFIRGVIHDKLRVIRKWLMDNGMIADEAKTGTESSAAKAAREAVEEADRELGNKERELQQEKTDLDKDYGPSGIFRSLKGKCAEIDAGEYTYELCWLDKTLQKSKKGHAATNMGNFDRIEIAMADEDERVDGRSLGSGPRMVLRYENGQTCWNGPQRRTNVWLGCAEKEEIWRVSEAEKCVYKMEVGTPAACEDQEPATKDSGKDEL